MQTDPIADMLTRIRNANKALHEEVRMPTSRMKESIARILVEEGYVRDCRIEKGESFDTLVIQLKFGRNRERVISGLRRVSRPAAASTRAAIACHACSAAWAPLFFPPPRAWSRAVVRRKRASGARSSVSFGDSCREGR